MVCARICIAKHSPSLPAMLGMPLLLVREIRNLVSEKSGKMLLPTVPRW